MIRSVLTVCVGNICRSPMAEALLRAKLPELEIASAGLAAPSGAFADPMAQELMLERGMNISSHRATRVIPPSIAGSDLILVMDLEQKSTIEREHPIARGKVFRLGEFGKFEIFDPFRLGREEFVKCLNLIDQGVDAWVKRIHAVA
ncbi:low molecular weight protein-tyrosine-phosphatase [Paraburkholderia aspalathi]|uniref:protein-tyrosine-phosphatase n=1 Tax=Paraburkholderia aspalathi TaxID=1324617 RepID=A0A1I7ELK9_9BURK|nr:low molecular weight protein-tyrosine-phosphatase [Paraburkholderia aspalathi]SFU24820.1 protein tyrosine phosphatase [Paraburkholderia aspalathi]